MQTILSTFIAINLTIYIIFYMLDVALYALVDGAEKSKTSTLNNDNWSAEAKKEVHQMDMYVLWYCSYIDQFIMPTVRRTSRALFVIASLLLITLKLGGWL
jgi:uncharacterized membrane protein YcgQ (UPF0703/DUF1980 family)